MFSEGTEGLRHCQKSLFLSPLQLLTLSDGSPHVCRSALDLHSHSQTKHAIFHHLLNNADASQHFSEHIRQDKTCILAMLHFINTTVGSKCCSLEPMGKCGNTGYPCHTHCWECWGSVWDNFYSIICSPEGRVTALTRDSRTTGAPR